MSESADNGVTMNDDGPPDGLIDRAGRNLNRFSDSFGLVFVLIVATLLATALLGDVRWGRAITATLMAATLLLTFRASRVPRRRRRFFMVLITALLAVAVIASLTGDAAANTILATVIAALFVVAASTAIVQRLRSQTAVSMRTVMGALCIYLFIGLFFAVVYNGVDLVDEGPFFAQTDAAGGVDFIYFSFITQATVGYGDLTPLTDLGRMLAITEALLGQVYLVTIVAALVSNIGRTRPAERLIGRTRDQADEPGDPLPGVGDEPSGAAQSGRAEPPDGGP
jgi:uncharacterized membrane protein